MAGCEVRIELERRFVKRFCVPGRFGWPAISGQDSSNKRCFSLQKIDREHRISLLGGSVELGRMAYGDSIG